MSRITPLSLTLTTGLLLAVWHLGVADEPVSKAELTKRYKDLVQQLVSPNEKAVTRNRASGSVKFPEGYDAKAQRRIEAARQELHDKIEEALPFLVEALDDDRYCMTINWADGDAYYNRSVGQICRNVIESQLEVFRGEIRFSSPQHWHRYDYTPISKEWWEMRKSRSLVELQIEAINWAIEQRMAEPSPSERRKDEVSRLEKLRDDIAESKKPAKSWRMHPMVTSDR